jgi:hypothetical protein
LRFKSHKNSGSPKRDRFLSQLRVIRSLGVG